MMCIYIHIISVSVATGSMCFVAFGGRTTFVGQIGSVAEEKEEEEDEWNKSTRKMIHMPSMSYGSCIHSISSVLSITFVRHRSMICDIGPYAHYQQFEFFSNRAKHGDKCALFSNFPMHRILLESPTISHVIYVIFSYKKSCSISADNQSANKCSIRTILDIS